MLPESAGAVAGYAQQFNKNAARLTAVGLVFLFVTEIYHLFVFRTGARVAARQSGQDLDQPALELAGAIDDGLQLSIEELFLKAARTETTVSPMRAQVV